MRFTSVPWSLANIIPFGFLSSQGSIQPGQSLALQRLCHLNNINLYSRGYLFITLGEEKQL